MAATNINEKTFREMMADDRPVLVDFWAPWCSYCRRISDAYERVAEQNQRTMTVVKVNIDEEPQLAAQQGIEVIPTLVLYRGGKAVGSIVAPGSKVAIDEFIRSTLTNS